MCGIVGYLGQSRAAPILLEGLRKLEYRGYDSAGIATIESTGDLRVERSVGKLRDFEATLPLDELDGLVGIGHTRWATHGKPDKANAHPHIDSSQSVAVVHNGIIENHRDLRRELTNLGHNFRSQTDTEVIAQLIEHYLHNDVPLHDAVRTCLNRLEGTYAVAVLSRHAPKEIIVGRHASPLVIGVGNEETLVASDVPAMLQHTKNFIVMQDGEMARLTNNHIDLITLEGEPILREAEEHPWDADMAEKGGFTHFMQKEIYEQPRAIADTIGERTTTLSSRFALDELSEIDGKLSGINRAIILACGTSWHAGLVGKYYLEEIAGIPTEVDYGSEHQYRKALVDNNCLIIPISQSGETFDTLAAMRAAARGGGPVVAICNVLGSTMAREADAVVFTRAGLEIGVAATKTFSSVLAVLYLVATHLGALRTYISSEECSTLISNINKAPTLLEQALKQESTLESLADKFHNVLDFLYIGRGINYPIALEGALKLKEISYIHAEGYPAGEMKHGPIALITDEMPVIALAPQDDVYEKMLSNIEEAKTRDGLVIAIGFEGDSVLEDQADHFVPMPNCPRLLTPIVLSIPVQILAYHIAVQRGCDVDQPRNLAKTVTVE